jgi:hypothetical protein
MGGIRDVNISRAASIQLSKLEGAGLIGTPGEIFWLALSTSQEYSQLNGKVASDRLYTGLEAAMNGNILASRGDVLIVAQDYTETVTGANAVSWDKIGVSTIGLGEGRQRPTITVGSATTDELLVSAAKNFIGNMVFIVGVDDLDVMFDVNATDFTMWNCDLIEGGTNLQANTFIDLNGGGANAVDRAKILKTNILQQGATSAIGDRGIELGEVADGIIIDGCFIDGDWDNAGIHNPTGKVLTNLTIQNSFVRNRASGEHAIELVSACTGAARKLHLMSDAAATIYDPGSLMSFDVKGQTAIDLPSFDLPNAAPADTASNILGADSADNTFASTSVVANEDGSIIERLEQVQEAVNKGTGTALGANRSLVDELVGEINYNRSGYLAVTADFTSATWNSAAAHEIATVTGTVRIRILPVVGASVGNDSNTAVISLGTETTTNAFLAATTGTTLDTGEIWQSATGANNLPQVDYDTMTDFIVSGDDIGYTIATTATTAGNIVFHMWWEALDSTGAVAAGAGGAL